MKWFQPVALGVLPLLFIAPGFADSEVMIGATFASRHYDQCYELLFPAPENQAHQRDWKRTVTLSVSPSFEPERRIVLHEFFDGDVQAEYRRLRGAAIQDHLDSMREKLHKQAPSHMPDWKLLCERIPVETLQLSSQEVPKLSTTMERLDDLVIPMFESQIVLDGTRYDLEIKTFSSTVHIVWAGASVEESTNARSQWIRGLIDIIEIEGGV